MVFFQNNLVNTQFLNLLHKTPKAFVPCKSMVFQGTFNDHSLYRKSPD